ncbi:MAG TPA: hypothetical protein VLR26_01980 [Frankiaceae bacterium]|nr:hypothetical protein [Frankiaceae bacterium]
MTDAATGGADDGRRDGVEPLDEGDEPQRAKIPHQSEFDDDEYEEFVRDSGRKVEETKRAWGSWTQDREQNRRKVLRALVGLVVVTVLTGLLAYGCDVLRGPPQVRLNDQVAGYVLQPPTSETEQLAGRFEAAGATGPSARYYRGPNLVLFVAGFSTELPVDVVAQLLPPSVSGDIDYEGRGGSLTCGATADGSRCLWKSSSIVGGTSAKGVPPDALEKVTRELRAGALRS